MIPLKDLLSHAMHRAKVDTQVSASHVVSIANVFLSERLGSSSHLARAASYRDQILTIEVLRSPVAQLIRDEERDLLQTLDQKIAAQKVRNIRYKIVHHFVGSEIN